MAEDILRRYAVGGATRPDSFSGLRPEFTSALARLFQEAPANVQNGLRVSSGYRSPERQSQLWAEALTKYGSPEAARKWVAPPGRSQHNHGGAVDLKYLDPAAKEWAHANADKYGLSFPLSNENWHVELKGGRDGTAPAAPMMQMPAEAGGPAVATPLVPGGSTATMQLPPAAAAIDPGAMAAQNVLDQNVSQIAQLFSDKQKEDKAAAQTKRAALLGRDLSGLYG